MHIYNSFDKYEGGKEMETKEPIATNPYVVIVGNIFSIYKDKYRKTSEKKEQIRNIIMYLMECEAQGIVDEAMIGKWINDNTIMEVAEKHMRGYYSIPNFLNTDGGNFTITLNGIMTGKMHNYKAYYDHLDMVKHLYRISLLVNNTPIKLRNCDENDPYTNMIMEMKVRGKIMEVIHSACESLYSSIWNYSDIHRK